jgi:hypothetical protein
MATYVAERNFSGLNCGRLVEPEINRLASQYCAEHRDELVRKARAIPGVDPHKAEDLYGDVFISIIEAENEGEGYDMGRSNAGDIISVADFVIGRLKGYAKNRRYSIEGSDRHVSTKKVGGQSVTNIDFDIVYASSKSNDTDEMDGIQRAYFNAHSFEDEIDTVDDSVALRQSVEFCLDFSEVIDFDFLKLFKNIDIFEKDFDKSIFDKIRERIKYHSELYDALYTVIECAVKHRDIYDSVLATF